MKIILMFAEETIGAPMLRRSDIAKTNLEGFLHFKKQKNWHTMTLVDEFGHIKTIVIFAF
jgi:hypothetical protein